VIPQRAAAKLNIRFNTNHDADGLLAWIDGVCAEAAGRAGLKHALSVSSRSVAFYTEPGPFTELLIAAAHEAFGRAPTLATTGGTSDARYIKDYCPVAEMGLRNETAHMVDEHCAVEDVRTLARCYQAVLQRYFS
jgi:succinyl-diaminopimelate desuccinylase